MNSLCLLLGWSLFLATAFLDTPLRHGLHCPSPWTPASDPMWSPQRTLVPCCVWLVTSVPTSSELGLNSAIFALSSSAIYSTYTILGGIRLFFFILFGGLSFVLLFCIVLSESTICHKKENDRVEHRHRPYKPVVRASLTDQ